MHIAVKCHSFTVLRSEAYNRHCAGRHEKAGGAKKHSRETYSSEASPQGAFWCFVRLWCVRGVGGAFFFCPGLKKQAEAENPSFPWRKGTSRPLPPSSQKNRPHRGRFFCDCRKTLRVFPTKGLQSAARIICPSQTDKLCTGSLRGIFSHAHVARENDFISLPPAGDKLCEAFLRAEKIVPTGDDFFYPINLFFRIFSRRFLLLVFRLLALVNVLHLPVHLKNRLGA